MTANILRTKDMSEWSNEFLGIIDHSERETPP